MKKGNVVFVLLLILSLLPMLSAVETPIKISTYPNHDLVIDFLKISPLTILEKVKASSGTEGETFITFINSASEFDINAFVMKDGEKAVYKRFSSLEAGIPLCINLFAGNEEITIDCAEALGKVEINETETNKTGEEDSVTAGDIDVEVEVEEEIIIEDVEVIEEDTEEGATITGAATSEEGASFLSINTLYYVIGIVLLLAVIFIGAVGMRKKIKTSRSKDIKVKKLSEMKEDKKDKEEKREKIEDQKDKLEESKEKVDDYKKAIEEAQRKVEEAQKEIRKLKNADKIAELKKRMIEDEKELMKLRSGED